MTLEELHITHTVDLPEAHPCLKDALNAVADDLGSTIKLAIARALRLGAAPKDVVVKLMYDEREERVFVRVTLFNEQAEAIPS